MLLSIEQKIVLYLCYHLCLSGSLLWYSQSLGSLSEETIFCISVIVLQMSSMYWHSCV